jgi:heme/copper-type cytochrome/quinol oxidase subunit 2
VFPSASAHLSALFEVLQISDEVWISILMSAFSGVIAVGVMLATFYFIRRHRLRALGARGGLTEALLRGEVPLTIIQGRAYTSC